jgi:hypothetical protein
LENDTVVAITKAQMKKMNNLHFHYQECKETNQLLISTIDSCKVTFAIYDTMVLNLKDQIVIYQQGAAESKTIMKEMVALDEKKNKQIKKLTTQNKLLKLGTAIILGITAILYII